MKNFQIGLIFLTLFCIFRPLSYINLNIKIEGLNIFELITITFSYLLLLSVAINFKKIKLDFVSGSILFFCYYCGISYFWGSDIRIITQVTFPFIFFFAVRVIIHKPEDVKLLLLALIIAYCFPLLSSLFQIIQGASVRSVVPITGIERHGGTFTGIKSLAFAMFFFSIYFYMKVIVDQIRNKQIKWLLFLLLIISFICLFKTYSRTAYLGLTLFWVISLWGYNKRYFYIIIPLSIIFGFFYSDTFQQILFKTPEFDLNVASSGRDFIWRHNFNYFLESSIGKKLIGNGLGTVSTSVVGTSREIWSSHNDLLHVLMSLGSIGLALYFLIYFALLRDVYFSNLDQKIKYFYYGTIFSIIVMNFVSGVTLYRVGMSQQFWLVMGFFYIYRDTHIITSKSI